MEINLTNLIQNRDQKEAELISKAFYFSEKAHKGQKRESGEDYFSHPLETANKLTQLNLDAATIAAALLHDVVDDTSVNLNQIKKEFSSEIADLVEGVSKLGKAKYQGLERYAENLRKFFLAISKDLRVVLIKLTDRLHNMETIQYLPRNKQQRIARETLEIYAPIANRLSMGNIKGELEDLAFPIACPEEYQKTLKIYNARKETHSKYITGAKRSLVKTLYKNGIKIKELRGRVKHIYSFYKKLTKYNGNADLIFDIVALRVIVDDIKDCYGAMGIIHSVWKPLPNKIKDYIALPKPNGYKSLHTTVFGPSGTAIEIQIRTMEMHQEAEFGIATHWLYDENKSTRSYKQGRAAALDAKNINWIQQLAELQKKSSDTNEFLNELKIDFFNDRIFALTPKGDVIDLPEGATALDFAFKIHSGIGSKCAMAKVNQRIVPLDYTLQSGEIVEIITRENTRTNPKWLDIVRTSEAKHKIKNALKKKIEK
ncbi:MAG: RelA/SpoT family protein [bacterium]